MRGAGAVREFATRFQEQAVIAWRIGEWLRNGWGLPETR